MERLIPDTPPAPSSVLSRRSAFTTESALWKRRSKTAQTNSANAGTPTSTAPAIVAMSVTPRPDRRASSNPPAAIPSARIGARTRSTARAASGCVTAPLICRPRTA